MKGSGSRNIRELPYMEDFDVHQSDFLITINSNKSIPTKTNFDIVERATRLMIEKDLSTVEGVHSILKFLDGAPSDINLIHNVYNEYSTEIGEKLHRYHVHILMKIEHSSKIHIDTQKLKELVIFYWDFPGFDVKNPYINVKALMTQKGLRSYITKSYSEYSWIFDKVKRDIRFGQQ